jgi:arylsulfatase A-like enzyme
MTFICIDDANNNTRRAYHASIQYVDEQIGKILRILPSLGYDKNTFVVFTSDHGDMQVSARLTTPTNKHNPFII